MAEFRFYCVSRGRAARVLRVMLEKTWERGERSVVRVSSERREEELDMLLWMDPAAGFLPHGRAGKFRGSEEDFTAEQPILLTTKTTATGGEAASVENVNGASVFFHWQEGGAEEMGMDLGVDGGRFGLCCFLYEEGDAGAGVVAEGLWGRLSNRDGIENKIGFWYQDGGGWRQRGKEQEKKKGHAEEKTEEKAEVSKKTDEVVAEIAVSEPSQESLL